MRRYCPKCRKMHEETELCPNIALQIREHPEWLGEAVNFATIAGEYELITTNVLDSVAQKVNPVIGANLHFEGTHQISRDVQVFRRLNEEAFVRAGYFASPEAAQQYLENAKPGQLTGLIAKINGSGHEVDWAREQAGKLSSVIERSELLNKNAVGVDGVVCNRFTGKEITRVTIKATQSKSGLNTNVQQIIKAIKSDRLAPNETVYGVEGIREKLAQKLAKEIEYARACGDEQLAQKLTQAQNNIKVIESGSPETVAQNRDRILEKIRDGKANTSITSEQFATKAVQGAVIGAAIELTISGITTYVRYKNGEITKEEAYREIGESTTKGALVGGALSGITLFIPTGVVGFVGGMAIGVYVSAATKNLLDEIFGKGFYEQVLHTSGYVYGTSTALVDAIQIIRANQKKISMGLREIKTQNEKTSTNIDALIAKLGG